MFFKKFFAKKKWKVVGRFEPMTVVADNPSKSIYNRQIRFNLLVIENQFGEREFKISLISGNINELTVKNIIDYYLSKRYAGIRCFDMGMFGDWCAKKINHYYNTSFVNYEDALYSPEEYERYCVEGPLGANPK